MTLEGGGARRFAIGTVIRAGLQITSHNLFRFPAIIVAIAVPAILATALARMLLASGVRTTGTGSAIDFANNGMAVLFLVIAGVIAIVAYLMIQAALAYATLQTLGGRSAGIGAALSHALAALPRLFPAGLLLFVGGGVLAGFVGFLVLQLFGGVGANGQVQGDAATAVTISSLVITAVALGALTVLWVFVPAIMVERAGPIAGFQRSIALTKGRRGPILAIVILIPLANIAVSALTRLLMAGGAPIGGAVLNVLAGLFFMTLAGVLAAVGYAILRAEKEGTAIDDMLRGLG
jgi:hypothetical protein